MTGLPMRAGALVPVLTMLLTTIAPAQTVIIDDLSDTDAWSLIVADGVGGQIVEIDGRLRLDYDFTAGAGYCVVHREVDLTLDANYRFGFDFKGTGPKNTLEFKLIDPSGENVWWSVQRDIEFPTQWSHHSVRRRHLSFAWGPSDGASLSRVGAIEIAVTASKGGKGSIWIDDLFYERLPDAEPKPIEPLAISGDGVDIGRVKRDGSIDWATQDGGTLDFVFDTPVEFSAIELSWAEGAAPDRYMLNRSMDHGAFSPLGTVVHSDGGTDVLFTPEHEARVVRLVVDGSAELESVRFLPVEQLKDANAYFAYLSENAHRGAYPPYFNELSAWTVIGLPEHNDETLMSSTGAIEPIKAGYSIEPFIVDGHTVLSWTDASVSQSLEDGSLPIPSVHWTLDGLKLDITALATDTSGDDQILARYRVTNAGETSCSISLALAARPLQVLPAAQFLNTIGGAAYAESIEVQPDSICIDGRAFARSQTNADAMLTTDAPSGSLIDRLADGSRTTAGPQSITGSFPSAAQLFSMTLEPGESRSVVVSLPMNTHTEPTPVDFDTALANERTRWLGLLARTDIMVPESESRLRETIRANLAYILINADGPGIQPGSRSYERSWIRDGAMTSAALIALGHAEDARAFIDWYSTYQYRDGKIPCVVDSRGPDPVDENDAPGEFLFAIRNSAEAGGNFDTSFARSMYPKVRAAVAYIEAMRHTRLTNTYTDSNDPIMRAASGLMPESISHEGYSAKPMHSYWDDFWVYRGLHDAAAIAEQLGEHEDHTRFIKLTEDFGQSIADSVNQAVLIHGIDYVPGCVELGDFDATSTSIAYYPTGAAGVLNQQLLESTFERAWASTKDRIEGGDWDGMTPYEVRTIGTFIRIGWIDRAHAYLDWLMDRRDPSGWCQWGEIAYRDREPCRFVGDMPHTWVGSGAILSILSMFAYEQDDTIVLAAGVPASWLDDGQIVGVRNQITRYGSLSYTLQRIDNTLKLTIEPGCRPRGGFTLDTEHLMTNHKVSPRVVVNDKSTHPDHDGIVRMP